MSYYQKCPNCGANNDPGEKCQCEIDTIYTKLANDIEVLANEYDWPLLDFAHMFFDLTIPIVTDTTISECERQAKNEEYYCKFMKIIEDGHEAWKVGKEASAHA